MSDDGSSELASTDAETNAPLPSVENSDSAVPPPSGPFGTDLEGDHRTDLSQAIDDLKKTCSHMDSLEMQCWSLHLTWAVGKEQAERMADDGDVAEYKDELGTVLNYLKIYYSVIHPDTVTALGPDAPEGERQDIEMLTKWLTGDLGGDEDDEYPALKRHNEDIKSAVNQYLLAKLNPDITRASLEML